MADEGEGKVTLGGEGNPPAGDGDKTPGPVPYERFREVNETLKAVQDELKTLRDAQDKASEDRLAEEKKWEDLYKKRDAELTAERTARLRMEVAAEAGIPLAMAGRLQGDSREAMVADAGKMAAFLKPAEGPGTPPPPGESGDPLSLEGMTPAQIRENAGALWGKG